MGDKTEKDIKIEQILTSNRNFILKSSDGLIEGYTYKITDNIDRFISDPLTFTMYLEGKEYSQITSNKFEDLVLIDPASNFKVSNSPSHTLSELGFDATTNLLSNSERERYDVSGVLEYVIEENLSGLYGQEVTLSFDVRTSNGDDNFDIHLIGEDTIPGLKPEVRYKKQVHHFFFPDDERITGISFRNNQLVDKNNYGTLYIKEVKLEYGYNAAPQWTPNPSEGVSNDYRRIKVEVK